MHFKFDKTLLLTGAYTKFDEGVVVSTKFHSSDAFAPKIHSMTNLGTWYPLRKLMICTP